jgi:hypothetical protein
MKGTSRSYVTFERVVQLFFFTKFKYYELSVPGNVKEVRSSKKARAFVHGNLIDHWQTLQINVGVNLLNLFVS